MANKINPKLEAVVFNGRRYTRKPGARYYYANVWHKDEKHYLSHALHRDIWQFYNGDIPKGYHVHHENEDWNDNSPGNLICLTRSEHGLRHREKWRTEKHRALLDRLRKLAVASPWHQTKEAAECRRKRGLSTWAKAKTRDYVCEECKKPFQSRALRKPRFCSRDCAYKNRQKRPDAREKRLIDLVCPQCGIAFRGWKRTRCCSASCAAKWRWAHPDGPRVRPNG